MKLFHFLTRISFAYIERKIRDVSETTPQFGLLMRRPRRANFEYVKRIHDVVVREAAVLHAHKRGVASARVV